MGAWHDFRVAIRLLLKEPRFAAAAIVTLAIGIGSAIAIFSAVNSLLIGALPYPDSDRIVQIISHRTEGSATIRSPTMARPYFLGLRERANSFSVVGGYDSFSNLTRRRLTLMADGGGGAFELLGSRISPALLSVLGAGATVGRLFESVEEQTARNAVIVLSESAWRTHYGADPGILGRSLTLDSRPYTVVGVMQPGFEFPDRETDFWIPMTPAAVPPPAAPRSDSPNSAYQDGVFGRLRSGVTASAASAEVDSIVRQVDRELAQLRQRPATQVGAPTVPRRAEVVSMKDEVVGPLQPALRLLSVAIGLVLLIAGANVVGLMLARTEARRRDVAIRAALGAGRGQLIRPIIAESLTLSLCAGGLGTVLAAGAIRAVIGLAPADVPRVEEIHVDASVIGFSLILSVLTGLVVGVLPAARASQADQLTTQTGNRSSTAVSRSSRDSLWLTPRALIVIGEIAVAIGLCIGATLVIRSFVSLINVDPGYDARHVTAFQIATPPGRVTDSRTFFRDVLSQLASVPGVEFSGATDVLPIAGTSGFHFPLAGLPNPPNAADTMTMRVVSAGYFAAMGIQVVEGRTFASGTGGGPHPIVVNQEMVRRYFDGRKPVGQIVGDATTRYEVVGVVNDVRHAGLTASVEAEYYVDLLNFGLTNATRPYFVVRTAARASAIAPAIRSAVRQIDPVAGLDFNVGTMADLVAESVARPRFTTLLVGVFAAITLTLSALGIYSVMAYSVARRTREIGIRMALGAGNAAVVRLVIGHSAMLTAAGVFLGLLGAATLTRHLDGVLFGVTPLDPLTFVAVPTLFVLVAMLASYLPARRAVRVDPMVAVRSE